MSQLGSSDLEVPEQSLSPGHLVHRSPAVVVCALFPAYARDGMYRTLKIKASLSIC